VLGDERAHPAAEAGEQPGRLAVGRVRHPLLDEDAPAQVHQHERGVQHRDVDAGHDVAARVDVHGYVRATDERAGGTQRAVAHQAELAELGELAAHRGGGVGRAPAVIGGSGDGLLAGGDECRRRASQPSAVRAGGGAPGP
jgi:hypothetical protein